MYFLVLILFSNFDCWAFFFRHNLPKLIMWMQLYLLEPFPNRNMLPTNLLLVDQVMSVFTASCDPSVIITPAEVLLLALEHRRWSKKKQKQLVPTQGSICSVTEAVEDNRRRRSWESFSWTTNLSSSQMILKIMEVCDAAANALAILVGLLDTLDLRWISSYDWNFVRCLL